MAGRREEEVVISGVGGLFPECDNVDELKDLLFDKINGVTIDSRRWTPGGGGGGGEPGAAIDGTGKLKNIDKFDATFFSAHPKLAENMDPLTRICLERSIEAVVDAGLSPSDLYGTNTAVFTGSAVSVTEMYVMDCTKNLAFSMLGRSRTMQANRVSYILNLTGPSFSTDGGWICGSNGLEKAKRMIENGTVSAAIVGVTGLILRPEIQYQFQGLNRLNRTVRTKPFDSDADGYNRSEACVVMLLQKASEAKRSYGTLLSVKSKQFGDHRGHVSEHVALDFKSLLLECYAEADVDPATVEYVEANGSGIKSEDSMELNVMDQVFCTERRKTPLKVGSVKSNVGHCEVAGLFVSIVKAIIALDGGHIPPNINYSEPDESVAALKTGRIQVVTEKTPLVGDVIGISSFGILNAFSHVVLRRNGKVKRALVDDDGDDFTPRLLLASGRTEENARATMRKIARHGNDAEFVALANDVFTKNINAHFHRCFSVYPSPDDSRIDDVWSVSLKKRPVWFVFSGMGSQWQGMGAHLMKLPVFARAIDKCDAALGPLGVDIKRVLTSQNPKIFDNILNSFVGIAAVQIGLVDVLRALDVTPDGIIGHSVGELGCAYADGCFTAEEMILSAHARGRASLETRLVPGMMAAVGLGYDQIKDRLPADVDAACRNSATSCTISGPTDSVERFVCELKSDGVFARSVNAAAIAFHSRYIRSAGPVLLKYLKQVVGEPKPRSPKWISSSVPESQWHSELAKYSSPEYHTNNLLSSVLFEDALKHVPDDAVTIEIAPHGLLQAIVNGALPETVTNIPLTKRVFGDSVRFLLTAIGKMYASGINPKIQELYPPIEFPVSRGTPNVHSMPLWDHNDQWTPTAIRQDISGERISRISLNENIHLIEYQIHGHHVLPLSYVLIDVWKMFVEINTKIFSEQSVQFHDLSFRNNVEIHSTDPLVGYLMVQWGSGLFEYTVDGEVILSGRISFLQDKDFNVESESTAAAAAAAAGRRASSGDFHGSVSNDEIYNVLEHNGLKLGDGFKNIIGCDVYGNNIRGLVEWKNDWICFLDGLLRFPSLENLDRRDTEAPVSVRQIRIVPTTVENRIEKNVRVDYNTLTKRITCDGIEITDLKNGPLKLSKHKPAAVKLEEQSFIQFDDSKCKNMDDFINDAMEIITGAEKFGLDTVAGRKLIVCTPYRHGGGGGGPVSEECAKIVEQIVVERRRACWTTLDWDDVRDVSKVDGDSFGFVAVTGDDRLPDATEVLADKPSSFIIVRSRREPRDFEDWKLITRRRFDDDSCAALMKKKIIPDGNSVIFIKRAGGGNDSEVWKALEKHKSSEKTVCVIFNSESLENVSALAKDMSTKYRSQKLRFLFILDSNAPALESDRSFYTDRLSTGMAVNVYKNGGWGAYKRTVLKILRPDVTVAEKPALPDFSGDDGTKNQLTIKYLGLNFDDLVVEDGAAENAFGPLEYSGTIENNNRTLMGIIPFEQTSFPARRDALLSWPVPPSWTLEDAATVPLSYAMCYYVFNVLCSLESDKSILVTSGLHPVGQAAISIGLAEKCQTYAVVDTDRQADRLSRLFPELPRSRIISNANGKFDVTLKSTAAAASSRGVDFVLNFTSGDGFRAAFRALADHGKFFQFSKADMKNRQTIGTRIFLRNTSFTAVSWQMLFRESDGNKRTVQRAFQQGLDRGVIKPLRGSVLTAPFDVEAVLNALRISSIASHKVLLRLSDVAGDSGGDTYRCRPDRVYVVVGDKCSGWLQLAEWLADRGARKIVVSVNRCLMSSTDCRRFDRLLSRNVSVQIEPDLLWKTKEESLDRLNALTASHVLGSMFIIDQFDDGKIENLRHAFERNPNGSSATTWFVCISSRAENVCAELKSNGLNALNVTSSSDGASERRRRVADGLLISLDALLQKSAELEGSSFVCSELDENKPELSHRIDDDDVVANFLPESVDELHLVNDQITTKIGFVEVPTTSPRFSELKSTVPVFAIPGFRPKLVRTLYAKLFYPVFEARLPADVGSIDELSETLVNELKTISDQGYVSLIGDCWGGIVALKMAQILEAQGTLVTVSLLEGDPEFLNGWAAGLLANDRFFEETNALYGSFSNQVLSKRVLHGRTEAADVKLSNTIPTRDGGMLRESKTRVALRAIRSRLQALSKSRPRANKLLTKVIVFKYERTFHEFRTAHLNDYCANRPIVRVIARKDYKSMVVDVETIGALTNNVALLYPVGIELSLREKYENFYFDAERFLKHVN